MGGDTTFQTLRNIKTNPADPVNHLAKSMPQEGGFTLSHERDGRNNYPFHELAKDWDFYPWHCQKRCQKPPSLPKFLVPETSPRPPSEDTPFSSRKHLQEWQLCSPFHLSISGMLAVGSPLCKAPWFWLDFNNASHFSNFVSDLK